MGRDCGVVGAISEVGEWRWVPGQTLGLALRQKWTIYGNNESQ
jgi:hypothetical protein